MEFLRRNTDSIYDSKIEFQEILVEDTQMSLRLQKDCFNSHGFWPISFSYPRLYNTEDSKFHYLSPIVPGDSYSFFDENEYLENYRNSYFALSHRKAGFDCMRHLEILFSGSIPYIPDLHTIPKYTMTHYPRNLFYFTNRMFEKGEKPSLFVYAAIKKWIEHNLSSLSVAKYMIAKIPKKVNQVFFFDESLPNNPDYLSIMTLIGLKELLGKNCHVFFPVPYLYEGNSVDNLTLYGRGFGYQGAIRNSMMNYNEFSNFNLSNLNLQTGDLLVVGSIKRNSHAIRYLERFSKQSIYIYGEDSPISTDNRMARLIAKTSAVAFVREIF